MTDIQKVYPKPRFKPELSRRELMEMFSHLLTEGEADFDRFCRIANGLAPGSVSFVILLGESRMDLKSVSPEVDFTISEVLELSIRQSVENCEAVTGQLSSPLEFEATDTLDTYILYPLEFPNGVSFGVIGILATSKSNASESSVEQSLRELAGLICEDIEARHRTNRQKRQEAEFNALFHASPNPVLITGPNDKIRRANKAFSTLFGYRAEDVRGKPVEFLYPDQSANVEFSIQGAGTTQQRDGPVIEEFCRNDGTTFLAEVRASPAYGDQGEPIGTFHLIHEISRREEYRRQLSLNEKALRAFNRIATDIEKTTEKKLESLLELGKKRLTADAGFYLTKNKAGALTVRMTTDELQVETPIEAESSHELEGCLPYETLLLSEVKTDDKLQGYLGFGSRTERTDSFTEAEVQFCDLLTYWLAQEFKRHRNKQHLEQFFELSLDMLCIADDSGRYHEVNPAFTETLGYSREELLSQRFLKFVHPEDREETESVLEGLQSGDRVTDFENRYVTKDGSVRWLSWRSVPAPEGNLVYAAARDITEQKEMQRMKDEFISVVSHELRTPLTAIQGSLDLVSEIHRDSLSDEAENKLLVARRHCSRLRDLVDDILDIEKIESGELDISWEPCDLKELLRGIVDDYRPLARKEDVELRVEMANGTPPTIQTDPKRLYQILANLLSNAIKFSPPNEKITVTLEWNSDCATISIEDRGPGIPPEIHSKIFEKFVQADASDSRERSGTGLGLSIVKMLTEHIGGTIDFTTEMGEGTTFRIGLPIQADPEMP